MLKICLVFSESEPQYAYKLHAYKKKNMYTNVLANKTSTKKLQFINKMNKN